MNIHFISVAVIFGLGAFFPSQTVQAADPYTWDNSRQYNQYNERGYFGRSGSLKDLPYLAPFTPSLKDQPYSGDTGNYGSSPRKNSVQYYGNGYRGGYCVPRYQIREHLRRHGWFDFHNRKVRRGVIKISAQRGDGCIFRLRVDRCTGAILRKRLISRPQSRYRYNGGYDGYRRSTYPGNYTIY